MLKMSVGKVEIKTTIDGVTNAYTLSGKTIEMQKIPALKEKHIAALRHLASRKNHIPIFGCVDLRIAKTLLKHRLISDCRDTWHDNAFMITGAGLRQLEAFGK